MNVGLRSQASQHWKLILESAHAAAVETDFESLWYRSKLHSVCLALLLVERVVKSRNKRVYEGNSIGEKKNLRVDR